jgi:transposase
MLTVDDYGLIRRAHRDGMSIRAIARQLHHSRRKIRQVLLEPEPRPYTRSKAPTAPKLGPFHAVIDAILAQDESAPRKQCHTAMQVFRRLRDEFGYDGSYDQVRRYVARTRRSRRETFIPLAHDPGQRLEFDFGHIHADFPGGRRQVAVLLGTWSYSKHAFALALPTERVEAILEGIVQALRYFGCVPHEAWWDNPRTVAVKILRGRDRKIHPRYAAMASHYLFEPLFCMPRKGNEKPAVEHRVFDLQRRWCTPVPKVRDLDELNAHLRRCCDRDLDHTCAGCDQTIGQRFAEDKARALPLPARTFDACVMREAKVDKYQTVAFDRNRYSAPRNWAFRTVTVKAYVDRIEVVAAGQVVARHARSYASHQQILDPLHYLVTLGRRPAALDHSNVYRHWDLPAVFDTLRTALEARHNPHTGSRHYIRVLQLLGAHPLDRVRRAVEQCLAKNLIDAEIIHSAVDSLAHREPPAPCGTPGESLSHIQVPRPDLGRFNQLLATGDARNA